MLAARSLELSAQVGICDCRAQAPGNPRNSLGIDPTVLGICTINTIDKRLNGIDTSQVMPWLIVAAGVFSFALAATALYLNFLRRQAKRKNPPVHHWREDVQIDPASVPEFKPTWRSIR
jgi:hypothetical protein